MLYASLMLGVLALVLAMKSNLDKESIELEMDVRGAELAVMVNRVIQLNAEVKECMDELARIERKLNYRSTKPKV